MNQSDSYPQIFQASKNSHLKKKSNMYSIKFKKISSQPNNLLIALEKAIKSRTGRYEMKVYAKYC